MLFDSGVPKSTKKLVEMIKTMTEDKITWIRHKFCLGVLGISRKLWRMCLSYIMMGKMRGF